MIEKIAFFYLFLFTGLVALKYMKPNIVTFVAFSWFGPFPEKGELLSTFKARRLRYAFSWIIQFAAYFAILAILGVFFQNHLNETFFLVAGFAGTIGAGMAVLASIGFSVSWLKTVIIGPNPTCEYLETEES